MRAILRHHQWTLAACVLGFFGQALLGGCKSPAPAKSHTVIEADGANLRDRFNADIGKIRVVMLVAPTWDVCLRGASEANDRVLSQQPSDKLISYVIWQPKVGGEEKHVAEASRLVPDKRAIHYWDAPGFTIRGYKDTLGLPEDAWDIYMIYGPEARWNESEPPTPDYWMHQLGEKDSPRVEGPYFEAQVFSSKVSEIMDSGGG